MITLNGRPVQRGTKLQYLDPESREMWGDESLTVTDVSGSFIEYVGDAGEVEGRISVKELPNCFKHYDEEKTAGVYTLSQIADLLLIPDDRLDACLDGLKDAIRTVRVATTAALAVAQENNNVVFSENDKQLLLRETLPHIVWCDDDQHTNDVNINGQAVMSTTRIEDAVGHEQAVSKATYKFNADEDKFDVTKGEYEYYVIDLEGKTVATVNANHEHSAQEKARHHHGERSRVILRQYDEEDECDD